MSHFLAPLPFSTDGYGAGSETPTPKAAARISSKHWCLLPQGQIVENDFRYPNSFWASGPPPQVGRFGMMPGWIAVCSWRRLLASRHIALPFP